MIVEVESNPNCETGLYARFKDAGPARPVIQVKSYDRVPAGIWCWVIGWTEDAERPQCPAIAQRVEDSGAGLTYLVVGGPWGVRLKPVDVDEDWDLTSRNQWGEPYLSVADARDLRYAEPG
jgi:hypothetical protein